MICWKAYQARCQDLVSSFGFAFNVLHDLGEIINSRGGWWARLTQRTLSTLNVDPINWKSLQGIGYREKGSIFSFLFNFWLCLNMNVFTKRFRSACALEDLY